MNSGRSPPMRRPSRHDWNRDFTAMVERPRHPDAGPTKSKKVWSRSVSRDKVISSSLPRSPVWSMIHTPTTDTRYRQLRAMGRYVAIRKANRTVTHAEPHCSSRSGRQARLRQIAEPARLDLPTSRD